MARIIPGRYTIAIILFVIIIFIVLTIAAIRHFGHTEPTLQRFPPWISECPPYWTNEGNQQCSYNSKQPNGKDVCKPGDLTRLGAAVRKLSYSPNTMVDFAPVSMAERCNWAKACNVYWEGISDQSCSNQTHFSKYAAS